MTNRIGVLLGLVLIASGVAGYYVFADQPILLRAFALLLTLGLALGVFWLTPQGKQLMVFVGEAIDESRKLVWPTRRETVQTTLVIIVVVSVMATFLAFVDIGFAYLVQRLMERN